VWYNGLVLQRTVISVVINISLIFRSNGRDVESTHVRNGMPVSLYILVVPGGSTDKTGRKELQLPDGSAWLFCHVLIRMKLASLFYVTMHTAAWNLSGLLGMENRQLWTTWQSAYLIPLPVHTGFIWGLLGSY